MVAPQAAAGQKSVREPEGPAIRRRWRLDSLATAAAVALIGALWLHQALFVPEPTARVFFDRAIFLFAVCYGALEVVFALAVRVRRWQRTRRGVPETSFGQVAGSQVSAPGHAQPREALAGIGATTTALSDAGSTSRYAPGLLPQSRRDRQLYLTGAVLIAVLVTAQTLLHLDERAGYLYMTMPGFPVGAGVGADGYVSWMERHPTYAESWQFARQAEVFSGGSDDLTTGDHDARAAYAYLGTLLARPFGYFGGFVLLNIGWWWLASVATWYAARQLLGSGPAAFAAALLTAAGQGLVFMSSTPMSYVAGYAWGAMLLALAMRWRLLGWRSRTRDWAIWGWLCGVAGLFYFTHVVLAGTIWLFGLRRTPLRNLLVASALAFAVPGAWFLVGHQLLGLRFQETTAGDLFGQLRRLMEIGATTPLLLPSEGGHGSMRGLVGGFYYPLLALAAAGVLHASPRRRQWYIATTLCGLFPVLVLHMLPVTQRYGYLSYPGVHLAAVEGAWWLAGLAALAWTRARAGRPLHADVNSPPAPRDQVRLERTAVARWLNGRLGWALLVALASLQIVQANADLLGIYRFALAFGGP